MIIYPSFEIYSQKNIPSTRKDQNLRLCHRNRTNREFSQLKSLVKRIQTKESQLRVHACLSNIFLTCWNKLQK